jgi:hypothetical protein
MRALEELGEKYLKSGDLAGATEAFREAAICYRIDTFRNLTHREAAQKTAEWRLQIIDKIFTRWIATKNFPAERQPKLLDIPLENLVSIINTKRTSDMVACMHFLERTLIALGAEFYSPGGSVLRRILQLLYALGGDEEAWGRQYLGDIRVRVALDLLAKDILEAA